jgi:two-component system, NarL family, nitrate/nitrite response regulator NarL
MKRLPLSPTCPRDVSFGSDAGVCEISPTAPPEEQLIRVVQDSGSKYSVFIADRDSMSSDLLASALVRDEGCNAAAIPLSNLMRALSSREVDLVVIGAETGYKSENSFDLAGAVVRSHPDVSVVLLLNKASRESVVHAFRSGARGVFSRERPLVEFLECIRQVRRGCIWAGRQESDFLLAALRSIPLPTLVATGHSGTLTARELQVVQCAATGKTNKCIALEMGLSEHTVKNYLFRAFAKLGVSSRVELLFYLTMRGHTFGPAKNGGAQGSTKAAGSASVPPNPAEPEPKWA